MICIDNSVELMMQTFLQLPKRISGVDLTRKERSQYCENFPALLDGIEQVNAENAQDLNLGEIEWFHRLRNELYHQGNGLTVERAKVEAYAEIAKRLFAKLFGQEAEIGIEETRNMDLLGRFLSQWARIEAALREVDGTKIVNPLVGFHQLKDDGKISEGEFRRLSELRKVRNLAAHGDSAAQGHISEELLAEVEKLANKIT